MRHFAAVLILIPILNHAAVLAGPQTYRLYDGLGAYIHNPNAKSFDIDLDIRDLNIFADGPRELLVKIYDPDGHPIIRQIIPDDGITSGGYMPHIGGWDHELWYYALNYSRGSEPMIRFSAFSDPKRLASIAVRHFHYPIPNPKPGVYRLLVMGTNDHYITLQIAPDLKYAVCGTPMWLHGHGNLFKKTFIYVPKGTTGLHLCFIEPDPPQSRHFTFTAVDGKKLFDGLAPGGFIEKSVTFTTPGQYDDQLLTLDVSNAPGDYAIHLTLINDNTRGDPHDEYFKKMPRGPAAILAPDPATARAIHAGTIEHDGQIFWHMFQFRFHDWIKQLKPHDLLVNDADGNQINVIRLEGTDGWDLDGLPKRDGYYRLTSRIVAPPLCDRILFNYPAHHNRHALNLALKEMEQSLRSISTGDYMSVPGFNGNAGYIYCYAWQYWRAAWFLLQQSDAPDEVKQIVREAFLLAGDRLAFSRSQERVNGNVFSKIPISLLYCAQATGDPIQKELFETYFTRFLTQGWGKGSGISQSGDCQEHFAHEAFYGMLILEDLRAPIHDFPNEDRFAELQKKVAEVYSYTWCRDNNAANPWSARTSWRVEPPDVLPYIHPKSDPGPDFTTSVNNGNEWFAARRKSYYALTFHGRLCPMWLNNHFGPEARIGYGGGMLCQLTIPGRGTLIDSMVNNDYGQHMTPADWPTFHLHSLVGTLSDGCPFVAADSEHPNARITDTTLTSDGEVRDRPLHVFRRYDFQPNRITCEARLADSLYAAMRQPNERTQLTNAYEMIPFLRGGAKVTLQQNNSQFDLTENPQPATTIVLTRKDFGLRIELEKPLLVHRGKNSTLLIHLIDKPTPADQVAIRYALVPFTNETN